MPVSTTIPVRTMAMFVPAHSGYADRVRDSFARQGAMQLIGAELARIEPGAVDITLRHRGDLTQQHGFLHAGILSTIADSAGGYAGFTLFPADALAAKATQYANVVKPGRTLCIVQGEVYALRGERRSLCALMQQTLMVMHGKPDQPSSRNQ